MIFDIQGSTKLPESELDEVQTTLIERFDFMRHTFPHSVESIGFVLGDEFEVVLKSPLDLFNIISTSEYGDGPRFYIGVGTGSLERFDKNTPISQMHGPPFTSARFAINEAKEKTGRISIKTPDLFVNYQINTLLDLIMFIKNNQTEKQRLITKTVDFFNTGKSTFQTEIAEILQTSPAMVSKTLSKTGYGVIKNAEKLIIEILAKHFEGYYLTSDG